MPGAARRLTNRQHHSRNPTVRRPNRLRNRRVLSVAALFAIPRESGLHKFIQSFTPGLCLPFAGCVSRPHRQDAYTAPLLLHARRSDPDRPSGVSPNRRLRVGFRLVNNVATCSDAFNEAHFASGWCGHPSGLQHTLSTLHRCCSPVLADPFPNHRSASSARLDRGGWLALAPRGLSPRQKRQASLDALTPKVTGAALFAASEWSAGLGQNFWANP
jgi:hypothetical protein